MKDIVMKQAQLNVDDFGTALIKRIQLVADMLIANCQYHENV